MAGQHLPQHVATVPIRLMFNAKHTRSHSPRTFAKPRKTDNGKRHHAALPHAKVPDAIEAVRGSGAGIAVKLAFEFLVLTAARSGEVRLATWDEIDTDARTWTIPAERMKANQEHTRDQ